MTLGIVLGSGAIEFSPRFVAGILCAGSIAAVALVQLAPVRTNPAAAKA